MARREVTDRIYNIHIWKGTASASEKQFNENRSQSQTDTTLLTMEIHGSRRRQEKDCHARTCDTKIDRLSIHRTQCTYAL